MMSTIFGCGRERIAYGQIYCKATVYPLSDKKKIIPRDMALTP